MPPIRIDFYLLRDGQESARGLLACRLLEKAYHRGNRVFVFCGTAQEAEALDELLWTFKDDSFIPHNLQGEGPEPPPPIQIGYQSEPRNFSDILLNLSTSIPSFYTRFKRVIELVSPDEASKALSRAHYRDYRACNCELFTHEV